MSVNIQIMNKKIAQAKLEAKQECLNLFKMGHDSQTIIEMLQSENQNSSEVKNEKQ